jgi:hypothetical protein
MSARLNLGQTLTAKAGVDLLAPAVLPLPALLPAALLPPPTGSRVSVVCKRLLGCSYATNTILLLQVLLLLLLT